jgi:hypothetical protein
VLLLLLLLLVVLLFAGMLTPISLLLLLLPALLVVALGPGTSSGSYKTTAKGPGQLKHCASSIANRVLDSAATIVRVCWGWGLVDCHRRTGMSLLWWGTGSQHAMLYNLASLDVLFPEHTALREL